MSRGTDARPSSERGTKGVNEPRAETSSTSKSSIPMTAERARAIQAIADKSGTDQDFKSRAMSAADRNHIDEGKGE